MSKTYTIVIFNPKKWKKDIAAIPQRYHKNIQERIIELKHLPWEGVDAKRTPHYDVADYRLRVGDYRVLFTMDNKKDEILLIRVRHRSKLY